MIIRTAAVVALVLMFGVSGTASARAKKTLDMVRSPSRGFVKEIDEPGTRGRLTRVSPADVDVAWRFTLSHDGKALVYSGRVGGTKGTYDLYRLDSGATAPVKITSGRNEDSWDPSFTDDDKHIVFRSEFSFWKIKVDGGGAKTKVPGSGLGFDLYPQVGTQNRVAFVTPVQVTSVANPIWSVQQSLQWEYLIWTAGLDGSNLTQYREGEFPVWSPDGLKIAFQYDGDIWVMDADGTELTQLTSTDEITEFTPCFSPDGGRVAFVSNEGSEGKINPDFNIWYMNIDGSGKTQVTSLGSWDAWPAWGADGIYFLSGRAKTKTNVQRIWKVSVD